MTDADRKRLAAILGMLGSSSAGERDAAALQAEAFRRKHGLTWKQLVADHVVIVETPVFIDRPMPLVKSIVSAIAEPFPMVVLTFVTLATIFAVISRLLGGI